MEGHGRSLCRRHCGLVVRRRMHERGVAKIPSRAEARNPAAWPVFAQTVKLLCRPRYKSLDRPRSAVARRKMTPKHYHLIGIAGTAMGSLAGLLRSAGHKVTGSDANVYPPMSDQ